MAPGVTARLRLRYESAGALAAQLREHAERGALLLRAQDPPDIGQFEPVSLLLRTPEGEVEVAAEVLQRIPGLGLAVRLLEPLRAAALAQGASPPGPACPPALEPEPEAAPEATGPPPANVPPSGAEPDPGVRGPQVPRGMGVASWPIEKLISDWDRLSFADRVQVAKRGKRAARGLVLKQQDTKLQHFVLQNPDLTPMEVASMLGLPNLEPALLQRIAGNPEWVRHTDVARTLICHPKLALPQVQRLLPQLSEAELRRLARTGRVRAPVKRLIIRFLDGNR